MSIWKNILRYTVIGLLLILCSAFFILQTSAFQTWLAHKALEPLQQKVKGKIELGSVHVKLSNSIVLKDLIIIDEAPCCEEAGDTLINCGALSARYSLVSMLTHGNIRLKNVKLRNTKMNLVAEKDSIYGSNLRRMFGLRRDKVNGPMTEKDLLFIRHIDAENLTFRLQSFKKPAKAVPSHAINWADLKVNDIWLNASNFHINNGLVTFDVDHASFNESTGFCVKDLSAKGNVGKGGTRLKDVVLDDGNSVLKMDFDMIGKTMDFRKFATNVVMRADIKDGDLAAVTLSHFVPAISPKAQDRLHFKGNYKGSIPDMSFDRLCVAAHGETMGLELTGTVQGLPNIANTALNLKVGLARLTSHGISSEVSDLLEKDINDIDNFGKGQTYGGGITIKGKPSHLLVGLKLRQGKDGGRLDLNSKVENLLKKGAEPIKISGRVSTDALDIAKILGKGKLGAVTVSSNFNVCLPTKKTKLSAELDSLKFLSVNFNGCEYTGIEGSAAIEDKAIIACLKARDKVLDADLTIGSPDEGYKIVADIRKADLHAMNFDVRTVSVASAYITADLDRNIKEPKGNILVKDLRLESPDGIHRVGDVKVTSDCTDGIFDIHLHSEFAEADLKGNRKTGMNGQINTGNFANLLAFLKPGAYIEKGSSIKATMDRSGHLEGSINSGRIALKDNFIKGISCKISGDIRNFCFSMTSENIAVSGLKVSNDTLFINRKDSLFTMKFKLDDKESIVRGGDMNASMILKKNRDIIIDIDESNFTANSCLWTVKPARISILKKDVNFEKVDISSTDKWIRIDGRIGGVDDKLTADIKGLDLSVLNYGLTGKPLKLAGTLGLKGQMFLKSESTFPALELELEALGLDVNGTDLGDMKAVSKYDPLRKSFETTLVETISGAKVMNVNAAIDAASYNADITAELDAFPIDWAQPFVPKLFSTINGGVNGKFYLKGPLKEMNLSSSDATLDAKKLVVAYTHVPYRMTGGFHIDNDGLHCDSVNTYDRFESVAPTTGGIKWDRLKNMFMDIHFKIDNIEAVDIPKGDANPIKGHIFASGDVSLVGPMGGIALGVNARTMGNSNLQLQISKSDKAHGSLLTFVEKVGNEDDPYESMLRRLEKKKTAKKSKNFILNMKAVATPELKIGVDLGNGGFAAGVVAEGNGEIEMNINHGSMSMLGGYTISEGTCGVNTSGLVRRLFRIKDGSNIKFVGDIKESILNLSANYETKASISTLIADTSSVSNRRLVKCGILVTDKLTNPALKFSISIPDLDPTSKNAVESALSTDDKVQKQFLSLLLSNNFLPDEQSGIVNGTSLLYSNVSEVVANQINNIFSRLEIPLDLGLNYQPSDGTKGNMFDIALSTQLFNNRVLIGGTLGNKQQNGSSTSTFFGDVDIQYKVTSNGAFRIKAFSHSADQYSNFIDNAQRNGIGLTWQQEFNHFGDWAAALFTNREKREKLVVEEMEKSKKTKKIILDE